MGPNFLRLGTLKFGQHPLLPVKVQDRLGVLGKDLQPVPDALGLVVLPLDQVFALNRTENRGRLQPMTRPKLTFRATLEALPVSSSLPGTLGGLKMVL